MFGPLDRTVEIPQGLVGNCNSDARLLIHFGLVSDGQNPKPPLCSYHLLKISATMQDR
jgi:hypothetical protein